MDRVAVDMDRVGYECAEIRRGLVDDGSNGILILNVMHSV